MISTAPAPGAELPHFRFLDHLPLTQRAVGVALEHHAGQRRAGDDAPFMLHTLEVASLLDRSGYPDRVIAAAVVHDVLEHGGIERAELRSRLGPDVANLVIAVSDKPGIAEEGERKRELRERVGLIGGYAAAVYAADKISKVRELRMELARGAAPEAVEAKLARHRASLEMLDHTIPGSRLVEVLRFELEALEDFPPDAGPSSGAAPRTGP